MNCWRHLGITLTYGISLILIFSRTAYASIDVSTFDQTAYTYYLDPGTGSIIIQVIIAALIGGLATVGVFWNRTKAFFRNLFIRRKHDKGSE